MLFGDGLRKTVAWLQRRANPESHVHGRRNEDMVRFAMLHIAEDFK